jgi:predicted RNA-binding Zn ribbon-like protein
MALIEIPNVYNSGMAASASGRGRLAIIGEPIVAVDLINTGAAPGSAVTDDLLSAERGAAAWWQIETESVPGGGLPDIHAMRRLRSALRDMIEALVDDRPVPQSAVSDLNFFTHSAPASTRLRLTGTGLRRCANPACSMIFIALNPRRSWCAPGVCGNRVRVARHHRRTGGT